MEHHGAYFFFLRARQPGCVVNDFTVSEIRIGMRKCVQYLLQLKLESYSHSDLINL